MASLTDGKPFCAKHDPERLAEREQERQLREHTTCQWRDWRVYPRPRICGAPATSSEYGDGRCAKHTREALAHHDRLIENAAEMEVALSLCESYLSGLFSSQTDLSEGHPLILARTVLHKVQRQKKES